MYEELKFIVRQAYADAYTIKMHTHPCYELVYYLQGNGVVEVSDKKLNFRPNTLIITKPNQIHSEKSKNPSEVIFVGFSSKAKLPDGILIDDSDRSILEVVLNIETEMNQKKNLFRSISDKLTEILILLITRKDANKPVSEDKIENIINYIESCANQNITISVL